MRDAHAIFTSLVLQPSGYLAANGHNCRSDAIVSERRGLGMPDGWRSGTAKAISRRRTIAS